MIIAVYSIILMGAIVKTEETRMFVMVNGIKLGVILGIYEHGRLHLHNYQIISVKWLPEGQVFQLFGKL